ncbi:hypothetical protein SEA_CROSBY_64 [Streptomyces phage Crosby]|nr:hypothetical protein SEA_CROSBY_64 [Streptomyces phage Crosby]
MIKAECDRCGKQAETRGNASAKISVMLPPPFTAVLPKLPEGWRRVELPADDERVQGERKELCEGCVNALRQFFEGDGAVPGLLEPESLPELMQTDREILATLEDDPRPNLTARAEQIASGGVRSERCTCAGAGFGTEDCVPHHPDGLAKGTHLKCFQAAGEGECPGIYRRGMFAEHMSRWHRIPVAEKSKPCPYCATIASGIMELGPHIAAEHPGDWQAWIDGGQKAG